MARTASELKELLYKIPAASFQFEDKKKGIKYEGYNAKLVAKESIQILERHRGDNQYMGVYFDLVAIFEHYKIY